MVGVVFLALVNREFQKQSKKMRMLFSNTAFDYIPIQSSEFLENRNSGTNRHCGGALHVIQAEHKTSYMKISRIEQYGHR